MRKIFLILFLSALTLAWGGMAIMADWTPEDGHKMHFVQYPNLEGWNVRATNPIVLADDWKCSETGWIKEIHWWGSWMHGIEGQILSFNVSMHYDIPANPPEVPYSRPGETIWDGTIPISQVIVDTLSADFWEGWYDPEVGQFFDDDHQTYYQYNLFLPEADWLWQDSGVIYWLNISATVQDPAATQWGWKSTLNRWNDDAVWATWFGLDWADMLEPPTFDTSLNLAFVINGGEDEPIGACCYPEPGGNLALCIQTTQDSCINFYNGVYEGDGVPCQGMEACCLTDGTCIDADALCCVNEMGGNPQGPGTVCGTIVACCLPGGNCVMVDELCCDDVGGVPQGPGTSCTAVEACCLPDGSCIMVDPLCCDEEGGTPQGPGTSCAANQEACCLGDGSCVMADPICCDDLGGTPQGSGTSCSAAFEACCLTDGSCVDVDPLCCDDLGGTPQGPGTMCSANTVACCLPDGACVDVDTLCCDDLGGYISPFSPFCLGDLDGNGIDDACEPEEIDTCEYYKPGYEDFAPNGMPDFDQKQDLWLIGVPPTFQWTHCGPVALANCFWWFDSKFETNPADPRPFWPGPGNPPLNDNYGLVYSFDPTGAWDDHDTNNVMPFVDSLAIYCQTNIVGSGTNVFNLAAGAQNWLNNQGLGSSYTVQVWPLGPDTLMPWADFEYIRGQVLESQDVILLLGFWEEMSVDPIYCERVGGHYVTIAGVCTNPEDSAFCISDPFLDNNEPIGHGASVHNDAYYISGPHGTIHHDRYNVVPTVCPPFMWPHFTLEFVNYGVNAANVFNFAGQNDYGGPDPVPPQGGPIHTILEYAIVICPAEPPTGACCFDTTAASIYTECVITTEDNCTNVYGGSYQGDGTVCLGIEACCLEDYTCVNADALCCVNELNGTPLGPGTLCTQPQACCFSDGNCIDMDPLCCLDIGGTPQGLNTNCSQQVACCLSDGSCVMADTICCDDLGGVNQGPGTTCTAPQACCLNNGDCIMVDPLCCDEQGGVPQGTGFACTQPEACCLDNGDCIMVDPICCDEQGGTPQGSGTVCTQLEGCCLDDGTCLDLDPLCCVDQGGTPQGAGTACVDMIVACCLTDGSCVEVDPLCCDDLGGFISPWSSSCMGDGNNNTIDDACEEPTGACCHTDGTCTQETQPDCANLLGTYKGDYTVCLGDFNGNNIDDICEDWPNHKMHYPQLPDAAGWDVMAVEPVVLADDWRCAETGWIKDIHFWGSWRNGNTGIINSFRLWIFTDIPANPPQLPYSQPGEELWYYEAPLQNVVVTMLDPTAQEGWYDPANQEILDDDHQVFFRYDVMLDTLDWFWQHEGTIYWLLISAYVAEPEITKWGWKSSVDHFNDDAVWHYGELPYAWHETYEPPFFQESLDLAFVITSGLPCEGICGDANNDGVVNVSDAVYIINYVFVGGGEPQPVLACGDANSDGVVNVSDAVWIINYVFVGGGPPGDCTPGSPDWYNGDCCPFVPPRNVK
jgi:hypothetical protein